MAGINKAILIGRLGKDPEVRFTPGGSPVATFSLATSDTWNDKQGQKQERTDWHRIVVWGKQAEICGERLAKGNEVYVEGRISTREWERDGQKQRTTEIVAHHVQFLGEKNKGVGAEQPSPKERQQGRNLGYRLPGDDEEYI